MVWGGTFTHPHWGHIQRWSEWESKRKPNTKPLIDNLAKALLPWCTVAAAGVYDGIRWFEAILGTLTYPCWGLIRRQSEWESTSKIRKKKPIDNLATWKKQRLIFDIKSNQISCPDFQWLLSGVRRHWFVGLFTYPPHWGVDYLSQKSRTCIYLQRHQSMNQTSTTERHQSNAPGREKAHSAALQWNYYDPIQANNLKGIVMLPKQLLQCVKYSRNSRTKELCYEGNWSHAYCRVEGASWRYPATPYTLVFEHLVWVLHWRLSTPRRQLVHHI